MEFEEKHLVKKFGALVDTWPIEGMSPGASQIVIIGNEVAMPGAGDGGGTGSVDLLAVDDRGELWVIEAKLKINAQKDPAYLFGNQLMRFARHIQENGPNVVHRGLEGYIFGRRAFLKPPALLGEKWRNASVVVKFFWPRNSSYSSNFSLRHLALLLRLSLNSTVLGSDPLERVLAVRALSVWRESWLSVLYRYRELQAGKYELTSLSIPAYFWQYSFNAAYTQAKFVHR